METGYKKKLCLSSVLKAIWGVDSGSIGILWKPDAKSIASPIYLRTYYSILGMGNLSSMFFSFSLC